MMRKVAFLGSAALMTLAIVSPASAQFRAALDESRASVDEGARSQQRVEELDDQAAELLGDPVDRLPGNAHILFPGASGESLLFLLDMAGVSVSTGSACQAGVPEPSHVVTAMGRSDREAREVLRFTLGRSTTDADIDAVLRVLPDAVERARAASGSRTDGRS